MVHNNSLCFHIDKLGKYPFRLGNSSDQHTSDQGINRHPHELIGSQRKMRCTREYRLSHEQSGPALAS